MKNPWQQHNYLSLSTQKRDGSWVDTPIWFANEGSTFYAFSEGKAWKVKRIRNFKDVKICPCNVAGKLNGEWENAQAEILEGNSANEAYQALRSKYGWQMLLIDFGATLARKKHKRAFIKIELEQ